MNGKEMLGEGKLNQDNMELTGARLTGVLSRIPEHREVMAYGTG
jgi:hypothetical protein